MSGIHFLVKTFPQKMIFSFHKSWYEKVKYVKQRNLDLVEGGFVCRILET